MVIHCKDGNIINESVKQKDIVEAVKEELIGTVKEWNPKESDLMVFSTQNEAQVSAPLTKETLELLKPFSPTRQGDKVVFNMPIYVISYKIEHLSENEFRDRAVVIIAPYINEELKSQLESWSVELTAKAQ
ncbi:hypothetical protein B9Q03_12890 [Candidatus Marsarchaeota G2 archaeon OSP_D]|uniref:DUF2286 domain-containing protein n=3 Tax=Candidatus Marsarchaeota group 2 TaxID=2203771 RepID=A0A2R6B8X7_9ARCH|nr:MAG: hypothetical protein B9Q03_12890 [Candidatus Marsarchaeota G2 archaeon OSP_D]PSN91438.1 MAG: hypothetical protein B9Q08_02930 [Candidatus Marsarchaeota G2 archaeon ECH_B_SAG-M15]PSN95077.1 MAG: hypothetical protein B9Q09_03530 [Candidatus Marsarchaeota G2 archaeon ECH_B_SAG-C16]